MLRSKLLLSAACITASSALFLQTAQADRRTGLAGNLLIQDPDDLFPFPQYTLQHRNMLRLDYGRATTGAPAGTGNGVFTMGDEKQAFGIALHRGDLLSPDVTGFNQELAWLSGAPNPFGLRNPALFEDPNAGGAATTIVSPTTVADLSYGRRMGNDALGVRFGFGRGTHVVAPDGGDTSRASQTFFAGQFGYSILPPTGLKLDLSGNVVAAFGRNTDLAGDDNDRGFNMRVGGLARGYYPINDVVDVGFLGNIAFNTLHAKNEPADAKDNTYNLGAMAGVGPAIHLERAKVAAYGGVTTTFTKLDDAGDTKGLTLAAPMVNMAAEVQLLDWLFVRTGAQYTWNLDRVKNDDVGRERAALGQGYTGVFPAGTATPFVWSAGIGLKKDEFYFDGVFQNAFLTSGPSFIGGESTGFMAMASATYKFGDVLSRPRIRPEPAPAPAPVAVVAQPVYQPAPAPVQETAPPAEAPPSAITTDANGNAVAADGSVRAGGSVGLGTN